MPDPDPILRPSALHRCALSSWENEGGAIAPAADSTLTDVHDLTNAELVQLRVRVIALENLMIAVLADISDRQLQIARDMADYISPRPGFTHHPLTILAAKHMTDLVECAVHFRNLRP